MTTHSSQTDPSTGWWRPLHLSTQVAPHVFGGRAIVERLGRDDLPPGRVGETWEISDVARTVLLPAAMGSVDIEGPADVLAGYRPDLKTDIRVPLHAAGHSSAAIAALGEGVDDSVHHL